MDELSGWVADDESSAELQSPNIWLTCIRLD